MSETAIGLPAVEAYNARTSRLAEFERELSQFPQEELVKIAAYFRLMAEECSTLLSRVPIIVSHGR